MKKILSLALVLVVVISAFAACTPVEEKITGKWTYNETVLGIVTERAYVFNADGTGTAPGELIGVAIPLDMTWSIEKDTLTIKKNISKEPEVYTFALKGETLTLTAADGTVMTLTKAVVA